MPRIFRATCSCAFFSILLSGCLPGMALPGSDLLLQLKYRNECSDSERLELPVGVDFMNTGQSTEAIEYTKDRLMACVDRIFVASQDDPAFVIRARFTGYSLNFYSDDPKGMDNVTGDSYHYWFGATISANVAVDVYNDIGELVATYSSASSASGRGEGLRMRKYATREETIRGAKQSAERVALTRVLAGIMPDIGAKLARDVSISKYHKAMTMLATAPANLEILAGLSEVNGILQNGKIDAGESVIVIVTVSNQGQGMAYDVHIKLSIDNREVTTPTDVLLGDISPGESRQAEVRLLATLGLKDGELVLRLVATEGRQYDSSPISLVVQAARLRAPVLEVRDYVMEEGLSGLAKGNGNGIIESGETVELVVVVENSGEGQAINGQLIGSGGDGIRWVRDTAELGTVMPGERVRARLAFELPRGFEGIEIPLVLTASEARGVGGAERKVALDVRKIAPELRWAQRITSRGKEVREVGNGDEVEVELLLENRGELTAKDVVLSIEGEGVRLSSSRLDVGEIAPGGKAPAQRVLVSVPRTYAKPELVLNLGIAQADFTGARETLRIPVEVRVPKLRYEAQIVSNRGANLLEHREMGKVRVRVLNDGAMDAEGVRLELGSSSEWLKLQSEPQKEIGRVPAGGASEWFDFVVQAFRPLGTGSKTFSVNLSQKDFPGLQDAYAVTVVEEEAQVVRVAGDAAVAAPLPSARTEKAPPAIEITSPRPGDEAEGRTVLLAATVTDAGALENVRVFVRNLRVQLQPDAITARSPGRWEIRTEVPVPEGDSEIQLTAVNTDYKTAQLVVPVRRTPEENVDEAPIRQGNRNANAVGVVIGISRYKDATVPPVVFAREDASTVRDYLVYSLGYSKERVLEAYDSDAGFSDLRRIFGVENKAGDLEKRLEPDGSSDVFVYFSGHGVPDQKNWEQYLMPWDATADAIATGGYRIEDLYARLSSLNARSVVVVMDACFSGSSERGALVTGASPGTLKVKHPILNFGRNAVAITASTDNQIASWHEAKRHGLFTYYFLAGLRGNADLNSDQSITAEEMKHYLQRQVPAKALQLRGREQTPQVVGDGATVLTAW